MCTSDSVVSPPFIHFYQVRIRLPKIPIKTEWKQGNIRLYRKRNRHVSGRDMPLAGLTDPVDPWQQINLKQELEVSPSHRLLVYYRNSSQNYHAIRVK